MNREQLFDALSAILQQTFDISPERIRPESRLYEDLQHIKVNMSKSLNSFVHSGIHALQRGEHGYPVLLALQVIHTANALGTMASMMDQRVIGVVENMSYLDVDCPHCGESHRVDVFGTGGGAEVASTLTTRLGYDIPLLAEVPLDPAVRVGGDDGFPVVVADGSKPSARALTELARTIAARKRSLAGRTLNLTPVG